MSKPTAQSSEPAQPTDSPREEGILKKGRRLTKYLLWYILEAVLSMGIMPLIVFPLCCHYLDKDGFGRFAWVFGAVGMVGMVPVSGLCDALLRNLKSVADDRRGLLLRTSFSLAVGVVGVALALTLLGCIGVVATGMADPLTEAPQTVAWIAIIALGFAARNILQVVSVDLTFTREFARRTFWRSLGFILTLSSIPAFFLLGATGFPLGYAAGHGMALALLLYTRRREFIKRPQLDRAMARRVSSSWAVLSVSSFLLQSGRLIHRTTLGMSDAFEEVAVFTAATTVLTLLLMPVNTLGLFGFQLMVAHDSMKRFSHSFLTLYTLAAVAGTVCLYVVSRLLAPWILDLMFPKVAEDALDPMGIMMIGVSTAVLSLATRPFVLKFSSRRMLILIGAGSLLGHLIPALILIPGWAMGLGLKGAAWAFCIGNIVSSLTWFGVFIAGFVISDFGGGEKISPDNLDPEDERGT